MKKLVLFILCIYFVVIMPSSAMASVQPDDFDKDGTPIYYIDVSPEEWEKTYLNHPFYQEYNSKDKAIFRLRDENGIMAICYVCGRNSMTLRQEWREVALSPVTCPGDWMASDIRYANTWVYGDYCTYCGLLAGWTWDPIRENWSWAIECWIDSILPRIYPIYVGASIDDGYNVHNCYSIDYNGIVHGLNCSCH